jgi:hypothetical protein
MRTVRSVLILGILFAALLAGFLGGCQNTPPPADVSAAIALSEACNAYSASLETLTEFRMAGELSPEEIARVDQLNQAVDPLCLAGSEAIPDAVARVAAAVTSVMAIVAGEREEV